MQKQSKSIVKQIVNHTGDWFNDSARLDKGKMTSELYPYKKLFEPIYINRLKIKNRIVMGPMGNISMADETGKPSQKMIKYFIERAKGGVGLITSGMVPVNYDIDPSYGDLDAKGIFPRIDKHRTVISGWRAIAEGCHAYGTRFFIQLAPGMGKVGNPECLIKKKKLPVSASWNPNWYITQIPCRPLTNRECRKIIKCIGQVALDAKEIGIDGVYLHGHSGYLIEQMTDPAYNRRKLGRYSKWQNFGLDIVKEIRKRCGNSYPIHYRIDLSLALMETYGDKMNKDKTLKKFKNGRTAEMTLNYMENLVKAGVDVFDVDLGGYENWWMPHPPNGMPPGVYLEVAELVKEYFRTKNIKSNAGYPVPVIAVGKLGFPDLAEEALRKNKCDMVMLARPLLADPFWPKKVYSGRVKDIIPCIGDHEGCLGQLAIGGHPHCAVNPRTAFEDVYQDDMKPAYKIKKIAVVGAGPAGVVTACTAAKRGHEVILYDNKSKAGGMLIYGSVPKIKYELSNYIDYLNNEIEKTSREYKLTTMFETQVNEELLRLGKFDAIVTCTGGKPLIPPIEGANLKHVIKGIDLLKNPYIAEDANNIVVVGGSDVGCEIAYMLSYEMSKKVTVIEMDKHFMKKTCTSNRGYMIHHLERKGVKLINCAMLKKISKDSVEILQNLSKTVPDPYVTWTPVLPDSIKNPFSKPIEKEYKSIKLNADLVIMCTGARADDSLFEKCTQNHTAPEVYNIGDSFSGGRVLEAVKAGYAIGNTI
ncbi:NAD(P)/FAD-dependent oxidoreductase [Paramaledivibacter caminithermalis]|jgi:2-enoate reductase|uniref:2-enoate reductase n=1 Tax=Paramaledivibacter caminithermalis (strain DSM 15212 / CIP 107654 / DViRD3) TaxID=1121301 RepID=A0A1M6QVX4_PARC5|nr:NAD(P)/FAD-dependent oxidoreductase [Paramaledivibacter caminithermalis]SHK24238.1 2-enoate reductase [Paramaledivibacter caminithermalis DSM 15212]